MRFSQLFTGWSREVWLTGFALIVGFLVMPALIFFVGTSTLGRYEGASLKGQFESLYDGLRSGSAASWIVFLGPYALLLLFRLLRLWWRAGART
jgi:hypothetical protein